MLTIGRPLEIGDPVIHRGFPSRQCCVERFRDSGPRRWALVSWRADDGRRVRFWFWEKMLRLL